MPLIFGLYAKIGATGLVPDGKFLADDYGGIEGTVSYTQANNTLNPDGTGTTGAVGTVVCTVTYTQAANTTNPNGVGTVATTGVSTYTQAANTTNPNGVATVKSVLLTALGQIDIGAVVTYTQANNTLQSTGSVATSGSVTAGVGYGQADNTLSATTTVQVTATVAYTQGNNTISSGAGDIGDRFLVLTFRSGTGNNPQGGVYQYAFFETTSPAAMGAPSHKGIATVQSDGRCTIVLPGSNLGVGATGYLVIADGSGDPLVAWRSFAGPLAVQ